MTWIISQELDFLVQQQKKKMMIKKELKEREAGVVVAVVVAAEQKLLKVGAVEGLVLLLLVVDDVDGMEVHADDEDAHHKVGQADPKDLVAHPYVEEERMDHDDNGHPSYQGEEDGDDDVVHHHSKVREEDGLGNKEEEEEEQYVGVVDKEVEVAVMKKAAVAVAVSACLLDHHWLCVHVNRKTEANTKCHIIKHTPTIMPSTHTCRPNGKTNTTTTYPPPPPPAAASLAFCAASILLAISLSCKA